MTNKYVITACSILIYLLFAYFTSENNLSQSNESIHESNGTSSNEYYIAKQNHSDLLTYRGHKFKTYREQMNSNTIKELELNYNTTNPRYILYPSNEYKIKIKIGLFCLGTAAGGTTSMLHQISQMPEIVISHHEMHYFYNNKECIKHFDSFDKLFDTNTDEIIENVIYKYCSLNGFENQIIKIWQNTENKNIDTRLLYFFEKSPKNMLFPYIANLFTNVYMKYYGTKMFMLLRDPSKNFISMYSKVKRKKGIRTNKDRIGAVPETPEGMIEWLDNHLLRFKEMNETLNELYVNSYNYKDTIWDVFRNESLNYYYKLTHSKGSFSYNSYDSLWFKGCYAPQLIHWIYYSNRNNLFNSVKIIQSEQLFINTTNFQLNMNYLRCYMHYEYKYDFNEWMKQCINNKLFKMEFQQWHSAQKAKDFKPNETAVQRISSSYSVCNKWLELIVNEKYPNLVLTNWEWTLWH